MKKNDLSFFQNWFGEYVKTFHSTDPLVQNNIELKEKHTKRVCEFILLIAKAEKLGEEDCNLAETVALFHDLGRFEQFSKYKTFWDSKSENHALLGVKVLKEVGILSRTSQKEQEIIYKAVQYHNRREIPDIESEHEDVLLYSRMVRDADKLDILKVITDSYEKRLQPSPALELNLPDTPSCSEHIIQDILNNRLASVEHIKNRNDVKMLRLSWLYDLNFNESYVQFKKRNYLEKIISVLPETREIQALQGHLEAYLEMKIQN